MQYVAAAGVAVVLILVMVLIVSPESVPGVNPDYFINVRVRIGKEIVQSGDFVSIQDWTFEKKVLDIQPVGGFGILAEDKGSLVVEAYNQNGVVTGKTTVSWAIGRFEADTLVEASVRLGQPGSGQYKIRATIYPEGEASKRDERTIECPAE